MSVPPKWARSGASSFAVLVVSVVLAGSCSSTVAPEVSADDPQLVLGRDVWVSSCGRCHSQDGSGGSGPRLAGGAVGSKYTVEAQQELIRDGRVPKGMPAFGAVLDDEKIEAVVRYTRESL